MLTSSKQNRIGTKILSSKIPKDIKPLLGYLAGYYRKFIQNFIKIFSSLTKLLKNNINFNWTRDNVWHLKHWKTNYLMNKSYYTQYSKKNLLLRPTQVILLKRTFVRQTHTFLKQCPSRQYPDIQRNSRRVVT